MILLLIVVIAMATAGFAASEWLWARESTRGEGGTPLERASSWFVVTFAIWTATNWLLAASHLWRPGGVMVAAMTVGVPAVLVTKGVLGRMRNRQVERDELKRLGFMALLLMPVALWVLYVMWRSTMLPVLPHDGLNYHMPKAVFLLREHGIGWFATSNLRIAGMPFNYELILSTILMLTGSDEVTAWPTTFAFVFFLITAAALAERFWGRGLHVIAAPLLTAGVPIALLHSGAHKHDLLVAALDTAAFTTFGRWAARGGLTPALLTILALALAVGSKFNGLFACAVVMVLLAGFALTRHREAFRFTRREWLALGGAIVLGTLLLGGISYGMNIYKSGHLVGPRQETIQEAGYGQWSNLWRFTTMLLIRPFASSPHEVWNPLDGNVWWWRKYDMYFSHFGMAFTVLTLALPFAIVRYVRRGREDGRATERWMASLPFLMTYLAMLPIGGRPIGMFAAFGRYVLFVVPLVVAWTMVPLVRELLASARPWTARVGRVVLGVCSAAFVASAIDIGIHDSTMGFRVVKFAVQSPEEVRLSDLGYNRAAMLVDRIAGPDDHIAVSGDFDTNLYPAFGHDLRRKVTFIPDGTGPAEIPADARWVIVDRTWNKYWANPELTNTTQFAKLFRTGKPSDDDLRVMRQLKADKGWKMVHRNPLDNQAVFAREPSTTTDTAAEPP